MTILTYLNHLEPSTRVSIVAILEKGDPILTEASLRLIITDDNDFEICKKHLKSMVEQQLYLSTIPESHRNAVTNVVIDSEKNMAQKMLALQKIWNDGNFLRESLILIKRMHPVKEKLKIVPVPDIVDFPFLKLVTEDMRQILKDILLNCRMTIDERWETMQKVVIDEVLLKECKKFLRLMKKEAQLLHQLSEMHRSQVAALLRETALTWKEKRRILRFVLKNPEERKKCREYMRENGLIINWRNNTSPEELSANLDFLENCPPVMNILILGETGVGKSTFINGIANYLKYRNMYDAKNSKKLEILISSYFTLTDENAIGFQKCIMNKFQCNQVKIICKAEGDRNSENFDDGTSSTLASKSYVFEWGLPGEKKQIRLIDTPGVGDVGGYDKDRQNFDNIFTHLADYKELHGICILLKPNESKLDTTFTYCLGELLSRLHKSALKNLLFCFTNTRNTLYRPGETIATLNAYIKKLEAQRQVQIPLTRASLFCFDNESFRCLCAWKKNIKFSDGHIQDFNGSWKRSVEETFRFFMRISQLRPHNLVESLCIQNIRSVYDILTRPLTELNSKVQIIDKIIQDLQVELSELQSDLDKKTMELSRDLLTTSRQTTKRVDTVCMSGKCCRADEYTTEKRYKVCHNGCSCVKAKLEICPEVNLQKCSCIDKTTLICSCCGCLWLTHMHINYELVTTKEKVVDTTVQAAINTLEDKKSKITKKITSEQLRKASVLSESGKLGDQGAQFVAYLLKNAVLHYNAHKKDYLEKLIKEEKQKVVQGKAERLEHYLQEHSFQVALIDACKENSSKTAEEMEQLIAIIQERKDNGSPLLNQTLGWITRVKKLILLKVRSEPMMTKTTLNLNDGWIGDYLERSP